MALTPGIAGAQRMMPPPPPPPEVPAAPAPMQPMQPATPGTTPGAPSSADADRRAAEMEAKLRVLEQSNAEMRQQMEALRKQQDAQQLLLPPAAGTPGKPHDPNVLMPGMVPGATTVLGLQLKFSGALTLRYDYWHNSDLTDQFTSNWVNNGFRQRIRFGVEFADPKTALVIGGLRLSTGESTNPTVPFIPLGDSFRSSAFNMDQAWIAIRPLNDRTRLAIYLGRMPNQTWRGTAGTLRTEMIWDDDISPQGIAVKATLFKVPDALDLRVENLLAYYQIQETQDLRFVGQTGTTGLFQEQLKIATTLATGAVAFYDFENLNNGLSSPGIDFGSVSTQTPTDALLFRSGLNNGNGRFAYGPMQATGFVSNHFRIINPTLQIHVPFASERLGKPEVYLMGDYAYNFSAKPDQRDGEGITLGTRLGDYEPTSALNPLNAWLTYRHVKPDTTVAAIADSDLGAGTDYKGIEAGISYRITKHLMPAVSYFDYYGFPLMDNHAERILLDITGDF